MVRQSITLINEWVHCWTGPVSLPTGPNVEEVGGGAGDVALDGHVLPSTPDPNCLQYCSLPDPGAWTESTACPPTPFETIFKLSAHPCKGPPFPRVSIMSMQNVSSKAYFPIFKWPPPVQKLLSTPENVSTVLTAFYGPGN